MNDQTRNLIIAVIFSALILLGWSSFMDRFYPANPEALVEAGGKTVAAPDEEQLKDARPASQIKPVGAALAEAKRVKIDAPRVSGSINLKGALLDDLTLTDHRETIEKDSGPVRLFGPAGTREQYYARFGWTAKGVDVPGADSIWTADSEQLTPGNPVTLSWSNDTGQTFTITYKIDDNYLITADQAVSNTGGGSLAVTPFALLNRTSLTASKDQWLIHSGPVGVYEGKVSFDDNYKDVEEAGRKGIVHGAGVGWFGFTDQYWLAALVPGAKDAEARIRSFGENIFQTELLYRPETVAAGKRAEQTTQLFAGAKETELLDQYTDSGILLLDRAVDWGWFYWFEKPIFYLLHWLFQQIRNFGVAIIVLTLIIRGLMFPVAQRQFASMAGMRAVQPKLKALQERYKDDRAKLQEEMMALYRKEKINPLAGCLPILLQIPIFFALYKVLLLSTEMRHQPFALWIHDLSAPDPATIVNLFGLLDFTPPSFIAIGVLPVLFGVTMWAQFKLNPPPTDPVQQQVFAIMPWMLMFVMAPFAAGLLIYWIMSNLVSIAQQRFLYSRHPQLREQMKKDAEERKREKEAKAEKKAEG